MGRPRLLDNGALRGVSLLATALALPAALACPPITPEGTIPGTCDVGSPGCKQGPQCQSREDNAFMPLYHIMGNFTCVGLARVVCWVLVTYRLTPRLLRAGTGWGRSRSLLTTSAPSSSTRACGTFFTSSDSVAGRMLRLTTVRIGGICATR